MTIYLYMFTCSVFFSGIFVEISMQDVKSQVYVSMHSHFLYSRVFSFLGTGQVFMHDKNVYPCIYYLCSVKQWLTCVEREGEGCPTDPMEPPPPWKISEILVWTPLRITKLSNQHSMLGHHQPACGGDSLARQCWPTKLYNDFS